MLMGEHRLDITRYNSHVGVYDRAISQVTVNDISYWLTEQGNCLVSKHYMCSDKNTTDYGKEYDMIRYIFINGKVIPAKFVEDILNSGDTEKISQIRLLMENYDSSYTINIKEVEEYSKCLKEICYLF